MSGAPAEWTRRRSSVDVHGGWASRIGLEVAVRGVELGPVQGIVLGPAPGTGILRRPRVALAVRTAWSDEWCPLVVEPRRIVMSWHRWCAVRRAALRDHPWPTDAVHDRGRVVAALAD